MNTLTPQTQNTNIGQRIREAGIIAVLVIDELKHAVPVARALLAGGVNTIELTLRTPSSAGSSPRHPTGSSRNNPGAGYGTDHRAGEGSHRGRGRFCRCTRL